MVSRADAPLSGYGITLVEMWTWLLPLVIINLPFLPSMLLREMTDGPNNGGTAGVFASGHGAD